MLCLSWKRPYLALVVLLLLSCTVTPPPATSPPALPPPLTLPQPLATAGPAIPFRDPNLRGDVQLTIEPFTDLAQLQQCLALGQTVYAVTLQNTNVRMAPALSACRVGRIPRGTLVEVTGVVTTTNAFQVAVRPLTAPPPAAPSATVTSTSPAILTGTLTAITTTLAVTDPVTSTVTNSMMDPVTSTVTITTAIVPITANRTLTAPPAITLPTTLSITLPVRPAVRTLATAGLAVATPPAAALGYVEDIQPLFERTCIACHSGVVQQLNLQVTSYEGLMRGSLRGPVVVPGDAENSVLWQMVGAGTMPLIGQLTLSEKDAVRRWIEDGALPQRLTTANTASVNPPTAAAAEPAIANNAAAETAEASADVWLTVAEASIDPVPDLCAAPPANPQQVVSANLILPISCGVAPREAQFQSLLRALAIVPSTAVSAAAPVNSLDSTGAAVAAGSEAAAIVPDVEVIAPAAVVPLPRTAASPVGLQTAALGLPAPADSDGWLTPRGGFCVDQHLPQNERGITALAFAPDGRLFMALDSPIDGQPDTNILYDAFHPSRSIAIYDPDTRYTPQEILAESTRITGLAYANGAIFISRAGEVGWLPDGGTFRPLAGGFAVNSQLFHANNGIVITGGYVYLSAGGVRDGYSDGPIEGIGEAGAQDVVSGGNRFAARLLRAPLDRLINEYSINVFETAARGLRNPYGVAVDSSGRIWFTDNGATNVPENVSAGDEVNAFDPRATPPGTPEDATPYYGFPLALTSPQSWYTGPVVDLFNTSAPTSLTWAYGTIFFGQYGRNPGLYRLGRSASGGMIAERIMLIWPLLATATAPDGALWIGTGSGGLYRMTPGC